MNGYLVTLGSVMVRKLDWQTFTSELDGWLVGFYFISTFVGYLTPNPFHVNNQFYFKQFSSAWVHSLIVKKISISYYSVYSNSYTTIQFSVSTVSMSKTVQFLTIQFSISTQFKCKYGLIVKNISISNNSI